jgi:hypothetical protein
MRNDRKYDERHQYDERHPLKSEQLTTRKIPTRRLRWPSVSGGEIRNTGFLAGWEIQTIYAGYSIPLSVRKNCNNAEFLALKQ